MLNQATYLSLRSEDEEKEKFSVDCMQQLRNKLSLVTLPTDWLVWFTSDNCARFFLTKMDDHNICVDVSLEVNCFLSAAGYIYGQLLPLSLNSVTDIRQIESLLSEIILKRSTFLEKKHLLHVSKAKEHVEEAISNLLDGGEVSNCSNLPRLQFILGQLENACVHKKRRRYNIITQIMAIKTHLISPACYTFLRSLGCISLPHAHTLEKLYSSFGLENDFCAYLSQVTSSFRHQEKNVIVQMDEIHVKSDISYKGGKVYGPNISPENPTRTVFTIMVSSLLKKRP